MSDVKSESENKNFSRCIKINNWIFELKMVRAIRVEEYGQPYSAITNINFNGNNVYVDGLMTNSNKEFNKADFNTLKTYFQRLGVKQIQFDRFKDHQPMTRSLDIPTEPSTLEPLQLVSAG
jgi:hypothetical protein